MSAVHEQTSKVNPEGTTREPGKFGIESYEAQVCLLKLLMPVLNEATSYETSNYPTYRKRYSARNADLRKFALQLMESSGYRYETMSLVDAGFCDDVGTEELKVISRGKVIVGGEIVPGYGADVEIRRKAAYFLREREKSASRNTS